GFVWVGTGGGGVSKLNLEHQRFGHFNHNPLDPRSLSGNIVWAISQDSHDALWIGTRSNGLNRLDKQADGFVHFKHDASKPSSLSHNNVMSMLEDASGDLWVATAFGGLDLFDRNSGHFSHFKHDETEPESLSSNSSKTLNIDSQNIFWVGSWCGGLNQFDVQNKQFKHYQHQPQDDNSLSQDIVRTTLEDASGQFWVGTLNGLNLFDREQGTSTRYTHDDKDPNSLSHNNVTHLQQDSSGTLWVATYGGGLNKYNPETNNFKRYRVKDGLPNDTVYGILEDEIGNLWLSTNMGLSKFNPKTETFKNYDVVDGLQSNEFNSGAHFKGKDGELFFGGTNGFNRFYPQNIKDNTTVPTVVFTDFLLFNKSVVINPDAPQNSDIFTLPKAIDALLELTLGHQQALVTFEFAALDHANPNRNRYQYKLEGFDNHWIDADASIRRATYTSLPSGHYTLRVKAANPDGYWNEQGATINLIVNPPPWRSWWAHLIYVLFTAALVFGALRFRLQQHKFTQDRKVLKRLKQVDKLKDVFLANTSHELRTPLNGIIGLAQSLIDGIAGPLPAKAHKSLNMVVTSGKRLSHLIDDILDLSHLKHQRIVLKTEPLDLYRLVEVVLVLSEPLCEGKDLQLVNDVPQNLPTIEADENRLLQILHNLVGNGIKFSHSGGVTVRAKKSDSGIVVSVMDTGIGIGKDKFATIFNSFEQVDGDNNRAYGGTGLGLSISQQLVALHGGSIDLESTPGEGSTFSFTLPTSGAKPANIKIVESVVTPVPVLEALPDEEYSSDEQDELGELANDGSGMRLLLVDDEPINLQVLNDHLSMLNYQLVEAADGTEALRLIEQEGPFDMVLLDVMMPKLSGYEVCKILRESYSVSELPVIFLTAKNQVEDLVEGFEIGGNDYLTKPVDKPELLSRVAVHLKLLGINRALDSKVNERTEKLLLSEKLASMGNLMAGVAHEINNPANFVHICVQNLELDLIKFQQYLYSLVDDEDDEEIADSFKQEFDPLFDHLKTIKDGTGRITTIVKDLKNSTRMNDGEKARVCITDVLMTTINLVSSKFKAQVLIVTEFDVTPTISCYPSKINQVFMNLLVNACDAMEDQTDGSIVVGCQLIGEKDNRQVEISFKDNGCGMTDETKLKLYEPFYTTKGMEKGTGLGLSISHDIVQKHDGELRVESVLGEGTVFRVILPV
ncbi:MAG: response regulator, partial [Algicola sp.]|nr:response regulator [Algicola sp.]